MSRRVVVTGMGAVTPIGNNVKDFWENVKKGTVGIGPITKFDTTDYKAHLAAEVKDFDPTIAMDKKSARRMEDFAQYAVVAAKEALEDSGYGKGRSIYGRMQRRLWNWKSSVCAEKL